jgi:hypothetical protein
MFIGLKILKGKGILNYLNLHHMGKEMGSLEKLLDVAVWILIVGSMIWFVYGCYDLINLFFIKE